MQTHLDPNAALRIAAEARRDLGRGLYLPAWYAPLYGIGTGGFVAAHALATPGQAVAAAAGCLLFIVALYWFWTRRAGVRVSGYRAGRTLPIAIGLAATVTTLNVVAIHRRWSEGDTLAPMLYGIAVAIIATLASRWFDRTWQRELEDAR